MLLVSTDIQKYAVRIWFITKALGQKLKLKVTGDSLHQEIFVSTEPLYVDKGSSYEAENKHQNIADVVLKTAAIILKQLRYRENQAVIAIVTISCVKFCLDKGF